MRARPGALIAVAAAVHLAPPPAAASAELTPSARSPAVAVVSGEFAPVRKAPRGSAHRLQLLRPLRPDGRLQVLLAIGTHRDAMGRRWYKVRLQRRPNGTKGWVHAPRLDLRRPRARIAVDRSARTLTVRRGRKVLLKTRVAVGAPGTPTPLGSFYVTARFRPDLRYLGAYALETSAYSRLSEWPGGGIIGIHGTNQPGLLGQAVSHGCIRVSNRAVRRLRRLISLGTPVRVRR